MSTIEARAIGCLIGGALGDALGAPVEFDDDPDIRELRPWGPFPAGSWTDDTEMTLATAEAVLTLRQGPALSVDPLDREGEVFWAAYGSWRRDHDPRRAPGSTCLSATAAGRPGTVAMPINDSKGCGGVMRVAPIGIAYPPEPAFALGVRAAACTHGHPMGYLPAGVLAAWLSGLVDGRASTEACAAAAMLAAAFDESNGAALARLLATARELAAGARPDRACIEALGRGWTGEEALAIATFCAMRYAGDYLAGICAAVNHAGDSDSTGAIAGQLLGAHLGASAIPRPGWWDVLETHDGLERIAAQLAAIRPVRAG